MYEHHQHCDIRCLITSESFEAQSLGWLWLKCWFSVWNKEKVQSYWISNTWFSTTYFGMFWWQKILFLKKSAVFFCLIFSLSEIAIYCLFCITQKICQCRRCSTADVIEGDILIKFLILLENNSKKKKIGDILISFNEPQFQIFSS